MIFFAIASAAPKSIAHLKNGKIDRKIMYQTYHHGPVVVADVVNGDEDALAVLLPSSLIQVALKEKKIVTFKNQLDFNVWLLPLTHMPMVLQSSFLF